MPSCGGGPAQVGTGPLFNGHYESLLTVVAVTSDNAAGCYRVWVRSGSVRRGSRRSLPIVVGELQLTSGMDGLPAVDLFIKPSLSAIRFCSVGNDFFPALVRRTPTGGTCLGESP